MYNKKVINYHIWSESIFDNILKDIKTHKPDVINIWAAEEHEVFLAWSDNNSEPYKSIFIENNIEVNYLFGTFEIDWYLNRYHFPEHNINVHLWPTYYLSFTYQSMLSNNLVLTPPNSNFSYPIISLNNRPHRHRCHMMDMLAKYDLIEGNAISWHNDLDTCPHEWKYWNPHKMILSDEFVTKPSSYPPPSQWNESFLHVISECSIRNLYVSEKTWMAILGRKLFIAQSKHGFHKGLKNLGFQLYDELFDYSFDSIIDDNDRCEAVIQQAKNLISKGNFNKVYSDLQDKINYNAKHALELATTNKVPDIVKKYDFHHYDFVERITKI